MISCSQMKAAIDISVLYIASAGIFYYRYNLVKAMLALPSLHEFVLLDYSPIEGWARNDPAEVKTLSATQADIRRVTGLKRRKLARVGFIQKHGLLPLANCIDHALDRSWRKLCEFDMNRRLRRHLADVEVFHSSDVLHAALPWAKNVATIHDLTPLLFPGYHTPLVRETQAKKLHFIEMQADAVIAVSESTKQDAVEHLGLDPLRVYVVHNGVDASFRPLPPTAVADTLRPLDLAPQEYVLHLGTVEPRKNLVRLIQAYHQVRQELSRLTPKLVQVGMKGWLHEDVLTQVHVLNLEDDVIFLGQVDSDLLPALYNGARLFVYPSIYEGFGLPVLEAMACGTPVITSNVSSLPEVAGDAAILVDPYDVTQIAEAIERMLTDEEQREMLSRRGLVRSAHFTWETAARKTLQVYEDITRNQAHRS
jgi:glycosyltransferase involved in cell wall biosynthesis